MTADEELIAAMHAAGSSVPRGAAEWLDLAQSDSALGAAYRKVFGKRLPAPQRLGSWLQERIGKAAGQVKLAGQHSAKFKAWRFRVWTEQERVAHRVMIEAKKEEQAARAEAIDRRAQEIMAERAARRRARELEKITGATRIQSYRYLKRTGIISPSQVPADVAAAISAEAEAVLASLKPHEPPPDAPAEQYELEPVRYIDGVAQPRQLLIDPRTGEPVKASPAPEPQAAPAEPASIDPRPPWLRRGESTPRDKAEWLAWQEQRTVPASHDVGTPRGFPVIGYADVGGLVAAAIAQEQSAGSGVHVCAGLAPWKF